MSTGFQIAPKQLSRLPPAENRPGMVRLVKQALRTGTFVVGFDDAGEPRKFTFTGDHLDALEQRFNEHRAAGITHPLCWGHVRSGSQDIEPDQTIAELSALWREGDVLYAAVYVPKAVALELGSQRRQVSVGLWPDWIDGSGRQWKGQSLMHLAIVSHPTVVMPDDFVQLGRGVPTRGPSREPSWLDIALAKAAMRKAMQNIR